MPLPEGYLPREGDVLVLHGRVVYDVNASDVDRGGTEGPKVFVRLTGDYEDRRVPVNTVVDIFSRKWNVGDEVIIDGDDEGGFGEVLAVHDDHYWLKYISARRREPTFATYNGKDLLPKPELSPDALVEPPPPAPSRIDEDGNIIF